jgi:hypothetical protein
VTEDILKSLNKPNIIQLEDQIAWDKYYARYNAAAGVLNASDNKDDGVEFGDEKEEED